MSDLIDRQAVLRQIADRIEAATKWHEDCIAFEDEAGKTASYRALIDFNEIRLMVESLPSAESEPKTGRWIKTSQDSRGYSDTFECSCCHCIVQYAYYVKDIDYEWCPNCGAKMEGEDE